ncbi:MAG: response regulator [Candidatus Cloacimonetes bacterium]|nr:response regulator [Candidatus Cloacimonadota bacterium]
MKKILVVDDELLLRDVLYDYLSRNGYDVVLAADGYRALELIEKENIDLALIDIKMPNMSGLELTEKAKRIKPELAIIVMTGYPSLNTAVNALKCGALEYIVKPFRLDELNRIIRKNTQDQKIIEENEKLKDKIKKLESQLFENDESTDNTATIIEKPPKIRTFAQIKKNEEIGKQVYQSLSENEKKWEKELSKLIELYADGSISEEEYKKKKAELLKQKNAKL